ncbi:hypothetical protein A2U01_0116133, partial [Trifolium medium]|nr:hypothetical protein [Trifolium medium]
ESSSENENSQNKMVSDDDGEKGLTEGGQANVSIGTEKDMSASVEKDSSVVDLD